MSVDLESGAVSGVTTLVGSGHRVDRHGDNPWLSLSLACEGLHTDIINVNP